MLVRRSPHGCGPSPRERIGSGRCGERPAHRRGRPQRSRCSSGSVLASSRGSSALQGSRVRSAVVGTCCLTSFGCCRTLWRWGGGAVLCRSSLYALGSAKRRSAFIFSFRFFFLHRHLDVGSETKTEGKVKERHVFWRSQNHTSTGDTTRPHAKQKGTPSFFTRCLPVRLRRDKLSSWLCTSAPRSSTTSRR